MRWCFYLFSVVNETAIIHPKRAMLASTTLIPQWWSFTHAGGAVSFPRPLVLFQALFDGFVGQVCNLPMVG
jgi:hypothetical protein